MSGRKKAAREPKLQPKRTRPVEKAWYILKPFILYMILKTAAQLFLSMIAVSIPVSSASDWISVHSNQVNAVINALASMVAAAFLVNDFLKEVSVIGEIDIDSSTVKQFRTWMHNEMKADKDKVFALAAVVSLGITSSLTFNIIAEMIQVQSARYEEVEAIQYSVPVWLGLVLYGLVSPFVEELVFRGLTYNRMRRYFGIPLCVIATSLLFAGFHANLAQFLYAMCMGVLMALCYEWVGSFAAPLLLHMAANVFVFILSTLSDIAELINPVFAVVFGLLSVGLLFLVHYLAKKEYNSSAS